MIDTIFIRLSLKIKGVNRGAEVCFFSYSYFVAVRHVAKDFQKNYKVGESKANFSSSIYALLEIDSLSLFKSVNPACVSDTGRKVW